MSVLKILFGSKSDSKSAPAGPETAPVKMNLDERMSFRREMLYEAIKVTMQAHGILSASYKFRVVRNDKRGHQYLVLIDLSADFLHNREGQPEQLAVVAAAIAKNAAARYGILVAGVYWQVNEQIRGFEASRPEAQPSGGGATAPDSLTPDSLTPRQKYERATADELAAFEAAWQKGREMDLGDRIYASDLAPLTGGQGDDDSKR
jgi:hypothetical protein